MKNLKLPGGSKLFFLSITMMAFFIIACNKTSMYQSQLTPSTNTIALNEDSIFKSFVSDIKVYNEVISNAPSDSIMNEEDFESNFNNAVKNNNAGSKKLIANTLGFSNDEDFWEIRNKMVNKIHILSKKYDFKNISINNLEKMVSNQISNSKNIYLSNKRVNNMGGDAGAPNCLEYFKNCTDQATAQYAAEQVACVATGELAWTLPGFALFIACEAASNYHLYINDRTCRSNLKYCK